MKARTLEINEEGGRVGASTPSTVSRNKIIGVTGSPLDVKDTRHTLDLATRSLLGLVSSPRNKNSVIRGLP